MGFVIFRSKKSARPHFTRGRRARVGLVRRMRASGSVHTDVVQYQHPQYGHDADTSGPATAHHPKSRRKSRRSPAIRGGVDPLARDIPTQSPPARFCSLWTTKRSVIVTGDNQSPAAAAQVRHRRDRCPHSARPRDVLALRFGPDCRTVGYGQTEIYSATT